MRPPSWASRTADREGDGRGHRAKHAAGVARLRGTREPTPAEQIISAARELFSCVDELHYSYDWPYEHAEERAFDAVQEGRRRLGREPAMNEADLLAAVMPITWEWWPERSPMVAAARAAVERIRRAAVLAKYAEGPRHSVSEAA